MKLNGIYIYGLFEREDIPFDFTNSPRFLVGPNGTGKSTSLRIVYYLLTAQWERLSEMPFVALELVVADRHYVLDRAEFGSIARLRNSLMRYVRRTRGHFLFPSGSAEVAQFFDPSRVRPNSNRINVRPRELRVPDNYDELAAVHNFVEEHTRGSVLYFPTYRRVERDLSELLETSSDWEESSVDLTPSIVARFNSYGEVVGFGGQDIKRLLAEAASRIENEARRALNEHSVKFLEAVARSKAESTGGLRKIITSPDKVEKLLRRITALSPSTVDMNQIERGVRGLREKLSKKGMGRLTQREDMLLFYIGELLKLTNRIDTLSSDLRNFSEIVQSYFKPLKTVELNDFDNSISIKDSNGIELDSDVLSSGEKQILAIFAFLMLPEERKGKYLIIDEPELSLSVGWQKALIEDIVRTRTAETIIAATHSPFIIERFSLDNVISLGEL